MPSSKNISAVMIFTSIFLKRIGVRLILVNSRIPEQTQIGVPSKMMCIRARLHFD